MYGQCVWYIIIVSLVSDDDNRIVLDLLPGVDDCQDYINACYIDVCN